MNTTSAAPIRFGHCEVIPGKRLLRVGGEAVAVHGRAFDLLLALLEADGQVLSKDKLMAAVWPGRIVEENTLEAQVSLLRKALGADRHAIRTVSGRGYQFALLSEFERPHGHLFIAASVSRLIGREAALADLEDSIGQQRLVTLIGPGGIGKTRLALECARRLTAVFPDRVCIADLAPLSTDEFLVPTLATALGLPPASGSASLEQIAASLIGSRILLLMDNCEHLIDAAARAAQTLLAYNRSLHVLATSREALRIDGEYLYRVAALDVPALDAPPEAVLAASAVQLFDARLEHGQEQLSRGAATVLKARICRRLDGIPLAIELAAARVASLGLVGVAERLENQLDLLAGGNRTALPRQQTLRATLDWSFNLLLDNDRVLLRRLGVFVGAFGLDAALAVGVSQELNAEAVAESLASLVSKSLLTLHHDDAKAHYRLLEVTRRYANEKLRGCGELTASRRLHALYLLEIFSSAAPLWELGGSARGLLCAELQEDLREALRWALDEQQDTVLGIDLSIAALAFWLHRSQVSECLFNASRALHHLASPGLFERKVMKLQAARGKALLYAGATDATREAFLHTLQIAERLDDYDYQTLAIWGLWAHGYLNGPYRQNLEVAEDMLQRASQHGNVGDQSVARRMVALSRLCLGDLAGARKGLEQLLQHYPEDLRHRHILRYAYDQKAVALCALAYTLWLQGFANQAQRALQEAQHQAVASGHLASRWHVLTMSACPIALLTGGVPALAHPSQQLLEARSWHHLGAHAMGAGQFWGGEFWSGLYRLWQGELAAYDSVISPALAQLGRVRFASYLAPYTSALCTLLAQRELPAEALRLIATAIAHARGADDMSALPELLRCQGELLLDSDAERGEALLYEARALARQHQMKAWELRATCSLARLWINQCRHSHAAHELTVMLDAFSEGFGTADFEAARQLLKLAAPHATSES
ncbi:MAG: winged helix-turn-helix domain-containing protein [Pseudomonas sp.]|uniref:ATP-binding protein n=1 Tax=Pseudomonas sp. TaxID=306 RepID=UPI0030F03693